LSITRPITSSTRTSKATPAERSAWPLSHARHRDEAAMAGAVTRRIRTDNTVTTPSPLHSANSAPKLRWAPNPRRACDAAQKLRTFLPGDETCRFISNHLAARRNTDSLFND